MDVHPTKNGINRYWPIPILHHPQIVPKKKYWSDKNFRTHHQPTGLKCSHCSGECFEPSPREKTWQKSVGKYVNDMQLLHPHWFELQFVLQYMWMADKITCSFSCKAQIRVPYLLVRISAFSDLSVMKVSHTPQQGQGQGYFCRLLICSNLCRKTHSCEHPEAIRMWETTTLW